VLHPRQMEEAAAKLQEEDEAHLVGELWLMSSGTVSKVGLSGAAPQADGGQGSSSKRRRMGPTLVRELRLASSGIVSRAGLEDVLRLGGGSERGCQPSEL